MSTAKPYFGIFGPWKLFLVVDASSDLKLIILLIIVCINCTVAMYYYNRIILQRIILRIIQSYYFETKYICAFTTFWLKVSTINNEYGSFVLS